MQNYKNARNCKTCKGRESEELRKETLYKEKGQYVQINVLSDFFK